MASVRPRAIGGDPLLIVEEGVAPATPVTPPATGLPSASGGDFEANIGPLGAVIPNSADGLFTVSTNSLDGFSEPITVSILEWSTQRCPNIKQHATNPLPIPGSNQVLTLLPGQSGTFFLQTSLAPEAGLWFVTFEARSGDKVKRLDLDMILQGHGGSSAPC
jgi:hypothetical protein